VRIGAVLRAAVAVTARATAIATAAAIATPAASATPASAAQATAVWGIVPDLGVGSRAAAVAAVASDEANLPYGGGPVLHSNRTHVIFWTPRGSGLSFEPGYQALVERFLADVAAASHSPSNVYGLTGQYTDAFGPAVYASTYGGAVQDEDPLPSSQCVEPPATGPGWTVCLTDAQLQAEIEHVVGAEHLPTSRSDLYFLITPKGLGSCLTTTSTSCALGGSLGGWCAYHSQTADGQILYAVIPYNAVPGHCESDNPRPNSNPADPAISSLSHEHNEMITDPLGDGWIDSQGEEDGDRCVTSFGPAIGGSGGTAWNEDIDRGHYFLQQEWSNEDHSCRPRDEPAQVGFSVRAAVAGRAVRLTAHAVDPDGRIVAYVWLLGHGVAVRGRTVGHTFEHAGAVRVTVRVTDSAGNWSFYARTIRVARGRAPTKSG
jgi:hypothetical protein